MPRLQVEWNDIVLDNYGAPVKGDFHQGDIVGYAEQDGKAGAVVLEGNKLVWVWLPDIEVKNIIGEDYSL